MELDIRKIDGPWDDGYSMDKHSIRSIPTGEDQYGHMRFDTLRTEIGEALFQLKYRGDWSKIELIAQELANFARTKFPSLDLVIPMVASTNRGRQPVNELAKRVAEILGVQYIDSIFSKSTTGHLKDLVSKEEKIAALAPSLTIHHDKINNGNWKVLVVDDLYDTGASIETICSLLRTNQNIAEVYVLTVTRKRNG